MSIVKSILFFFKTFSIEPIIFFHIFANYILAGSQVRTNIILWKVCVDKLGYNETICENLDAEENEDAENDVQRSSNYFFLIEQWANNIPALVYSLSVGALSDDVGRKPLLFWPLLGMFLGSLVDLVIMIFVRELPVEMWLISSLAGFFGGQTIYYMGYYGLGSSITTDEERTSRLARFDGVEQFGAIIGTIMSPLIFTYLGNYGSFIATAIFHGAAFIYVPLFVKEPLQEKQKTALPSVEGYSWPIRFLQRYFIIPFRQIMTTLFKKRENGLRSLLLLQLAIYAMYWFLFEQRSMLYLWLLKVIEGYDGTDYAVYNMVSHGLGVFSLFFIMPVISGHFQLNEALILTIINYTVALGDLVLAFTTKQWIFYIGQLLSMLWIAEFSTARSLFTKCVGVDEVGKIFSAVGFVAALMPILSNPTYRLLYNATLETFPGAFLLMGAALTLLLAVANFYIYTKRSRLIGVDRGLEVDTVKESEENQELPNITEESSKYENSQQDNSENTKF